MNTLIPVRIFVGCFIELLAIHVQSNFALVIIYSSSALIASFLWIVIHNTLRCIKSSLPVCRDSTVPGLIAASSLPVFSFHLVQKELYLITASVLISLSASSWNDISYKDYWHRKRNMEVNILNGKSSLPTIS